jgi:hypothetical protein
LITHTLPLGLASLPCFVLAGCRTVYQGRNGGECDSFGLIRAGGRGTAQRASEGRWMCGALVSKGNDEQ